MDSFNAPYYGPWIEEVRLEIEKEGSFLVEAMKLMKWSGKVEWNCKVIFNGCYILSSGERVARTVRAV